jgi:hypothetical protein
VANYDFVGQVSVLRERVGSVAVGVVGLCSDALREDLVAIATS